MSRKNLLIVVAMLIVAVLVSNVVLQLTNSATLSQYKQQDWQQQQQHVQNVEARNRAENEAFVNSVKGVLGGSKVQPSLARVQWDSKGLGDVYPNCKYGSFFNTKTGSFQCKTWLQYQKEQLAAKAAAAQKQLQGTAQQWGQNFQYQSQVPPTVRNGACFAQGRTDCYVTK